MKKVHFHISLLLSLFFLVSCDLEEIDNYDGPDSMIHGGIYDEDTGELLEQDIINGMQIEFVEHGFENPQIQYMVVKNDGSYRNDLMFAGTYTMQPVRGNFVPVPEQEVLVQGNTQKNFVVQPYIRIHNLNLVKEENKIIATFNLEQTVTNTVNRIGLFAHKEPNVGDPLHRVSATRNINAVTNDITQYRLEINLEANSSYFQAGEQYYFRVGALINAPEAKFNYAPAVRLEI